MAGFSAKIQRGLLSPSPLSPLPPRASVFSRIGAWGREERWQVSLTWLVQVFSLLRMFSGGSGAWEVALPH